MQTPGPPKTAIVPVSSATIVIRPKNPSTTTSPSTSVPNEVSPAKRMKYASETSVSQQPSTSVAPGTITVDPNRVFPIIRQTPGRPTLFRPPNVVFPRSANVLNNGTTRYAVPFTTQSSGNPTRPYYGNPSFKTSRDRPQLHTFTRPTTSVIRLVTTTNDLKPEEINMQNHTGSSAVIANGMHSLDETAISKVPKEGDTLTNGVINSINQETTTTLLTPLTSMSQNSGTSIQFSTSFPSSLSSSSSDAQQQQMISIRPHSFPPNSTMITISSKPTSSLYQVVNTPSSHVFMQNNNNNPQQIVQTAIPLMLHTVSATNFSTTSPTIPSQPSIINLPLIPPQNTPTTISVEKRVKEIIKFQKSNGNIKFKDIPLPLDEPMEGSYSSSNNEFNSLHGDEQSLSKEATVSQEENLQTGEEKPKTDSLQKLPLNEQSETFPKNSIPQQEVVVNGIDPHISSTTESVKSYKNNGHQQQPQESLALSLTLSPSRPLPPSSSSPTSSLESNANSTIINLPIEESQILLSNVSQNPSIEKNAPPTPTST
jgi:hypothetical protein